MLRLTAEQYKKLPVLANESTCSGKTYIVTGSNSGLGLETARHLVGSSASCVVLAVRNLTAGETAKEDIEKSTARKGVIKVSSLQELSCTVPGLIPDRLCTWTWHRLRPFKASPYKQPQTWTELMVWWPTLAS